jgi:hypothetical protein
LPCFAACYLIDLKELLRRFVSSFFAELRMTAFSGNQSRSTSEEKEASFGLQNALAPDMPMA